MKKFIMGLIFAFMITIPTLLLADSDITFEWDSNTEPDVLYYNIYESKDGQTTWTMVNPTPINHTGMGTETWTKLGVSDGTYSWYGTAVDMSDNESDPSNIETRTLDSTPPAPPQNFWVSLIQKIIAWIRGFFSGSFGLA